jgi:hypothetical protein
MRDQLEQALREIEDAIAGNKQWMWAEHDRVYEFHNPKPPVQEWAWPDKNGRPILVDLLAAKGQLLAALAQLDTPGEVSS